MFRIFYSESGNVRHDYKLGVTSSNPRVKSSNPQDTSLNLRVTSSNPWIRTLKARVGRLKAWVSRLKHELKQ